MEVDSASSSNKASEVIFPQKLSENDAMKLNALLPELNADFERRCKMLMDRLDVTVMSFYGSSMVEGKEDKLKEVYNQMKETIVIPKPAGLEDIYKAKKDLLKIRKSETTSKTDVHQYTMKEVPPSRGGNQKLFSALASGFPSRGREFRRGRGNFGHNKSLQQQIHEEINRQLHVNDTKGPYHGKPKRGRDQR